MPCAGPLTAYHGREKVNGQWVRKGITFRRDASYSGIPIKVPCGSCVLCKMEYSRQWAMRCLHEKKMHFNSEFVTLTYDDAHLPVNGSLEKRDFQLFMKRLRKSREALGPEGRVRYYMCGEYGDRNGRPHYHALLFNVSFQDKEYFTRNRGGDPYFVSDELRELWGLGHVLLAEVNFKTAAYVARYVIKKVRGKDSWMQYCDVDSDGVVSNERLPEYTDMSRRPGIGQTWFEKYGRHAYNFDSVIVNGREMKPPKFYDVKMEAIDPKVFARVKRKRRALARLSKADNTSRRLRVKEVIRLKLNKMMERKL